jgi:hypothetical protein
MIPESFGAARQPTGFTRSARLDMSPHLRLDQPHRADADADGILGWRLVG